MAVSTTRAERHSGPLHSGRHAHLLAALTAGLAATMVAQATLGLALRHQYRDEEWITATWFANDWVTLIAAVPLVAASGARARRGSARGRLVWLGLLAYAVYNYAFYTFGAALNVFFPLYVSAVLTAAAALIIALADLDVGAAPLWFRPATPVRAIGGYFACVGTMLATVWLAIWAAYAFAGRPTPVEPEAFKLVAALDIIFMTPVLVTGGVLLWRRHAWGYVLTAIAGVQASLYLIVLAASSALSIVRGLTEWPGELPVWAALAGSTLAMTALLLLNIRRLEV